MLRGLAVIMHLKYDKKVNTVINVFIFFCKKSKFQVESNYFKEE